MSDTKEKTAGGATPTGQAQDAWIAAFTGIPVDRRSGITIGGHRAETQGETPTPQTTPWQSAQPSKDAPKMAQPRDQKLAEIDAALNGLEEAAKAIGEPLKRTAIDADIVPLTAGRDALANAADRGEVAKQLANAPALLESIAKAKLAAEKDKTDCETLAAKQLEVGNALVELGKAADDIGAPLKRAGVQPAIDEVTQAHAAMGQAATREQVAEKINGAGDLLGKIEEAKQAAAKDKADCETLAEKIRVADEALKQLNGAADNIGAPLGRGGVQGEIEPLTQALAGLGKATTREALAKEIETADGLPARIAEVGKSVEKDKQSVVDLAEQKEKVRLAMATVETAAGQIGAPLLRTAIDEDIKPLTPKVEALNTAATREAIAKQVSDAPTLLADIEKVRLAAVKDKADGEKLATALQAVDNAIGPMNTAFGQLNPLCQAEVQPDIDKVTKGRDDLSKAATRDAIGTQLAAQPQLLLDIAAAQKKAEDTKLEWEGLQTRKTTVADDAVTIGNYISWVPEGTAKSNFNNRLADVKKAITDLDSAATLQDYKDDLTQLELDVAPLKQEADDASTPPWADKMLANLAKWKPVYATTSGKDPNPLSKEYDALILSKNNAGNGGDLIGDLNKIGGDASKAANIAKKIYAYDQSILRRLTEATQNIGNISDPTFQGQVQGWINDAQNDRLAAYDSATLQDLANGLTNIDQTATRLSGATHDIADLEQEVEDALTECDTAIQGLPTGQSPRTELENTYNDLDTRLGNVGGIPDYWDQIDELMALRQEALTLVQDAHTASFGTKSQTDIDNAVNGYGAPTTDLVEQQAIKAAIKASFGIDMEIPDGMSVTTLKQLYKAMRMVPKSHLQGMTKLNYETDPLIDTSYYNNKEVTLNQIGDGTSTYTMKNKDNPSPAEVTNYFTFTALHEFGHYVDDVNTVMKDNGKNAGFGKWEEETLESVVDAVYTAAFASLTTVRPPPTTTPPPTSGGTGGTGGGGTSGTQTQPQQPPPPPPPKETDLKQLIRTLLEKGAANKPASASGALGSLFNAWDTDIKDKDGWKKCLAIRDSDASPWNKPTEVTAGRYFHEGYPGQWFSYDKAERASGISNYQYRSPVEWFAEQYAFYRMKPTATKPTALAAYLTM